MNRSFKCLALIALFTLSCLAHDSRHESSDDVAVSTGDTRDRLWGSQDNSYYIQAEASPHPHLDGFDIYGFMAPTFTVRSPVSNDASETEDEMKLIPITTNTAATEPEFPIFAVGDDICGEARYYLPQYLGTPGDVRSEWQLDLVKDFVLNEFVLPNGNRPKRIKGLHRVNGELIHDTRFLYDEDNQLARARAIKEFGEPGKSNACFLDPLAVIVVFNTQFFFPATSRHHTVHVERKLGGALFDTTFLSVWHPPGPYVTELEHFMTADECFKAKQIALPLLKPSHVGNSETGSSRDSQVRTSMTAILDEFSIQNTQFEFITMLRHRLADVFHLPVGFIEPLQVHRYRAGQEYKTHCDWFEGGWNGDANVNRIATVLIYLNTLKKSEGGGTAFPFASAFLDTRDTEVGSNTSTNTRTNDGMADASPRIEDLMESMSGQNHSVPVPASTAAREPDEDARTSRTSHRARLRDLAVAYDTNAIRLDDFVTASQSDLSLCTPEDEETGVVVKPVAGNAVAFASALPFAGLVADPMSLHAGCPVRHQGDKWVMTAWVWNKQYHQLEGGNV